MHLDPMNFQSVVYSIENNVHVHFYMILLFRKITMTFEPNQRILTTNVAILEDTRPEDTEFFMVRLVNPTNGAEVGANDSVQVNILPNDDAFGIVQFAAVSRFLQNSYYFSVLQLRF
jgi:hypothetical protein